MLSYYAHKIIDVMFITIITIAVTFGIGYALVSAFISILPDGL